MPRRGENIRKRKDNRWEGRYIKERNSLGKAIYASVYGKTYFEVKQKMKEINIHPNNSELINNSLCFEKALSLWLENNKEKQKIQTYNKYKSLIENHISPNIGSMKLSDLNTKYINNFINKKINYGRLDGRGELSSSYIQTMCFIIDSTIKFCAENEYCPPIQGKIIRPPKHNNNVRILTLCEQNILINELQRNVNDKKIGIVLSLYAGLRVGEVCGLKWSNIDLKNDILHIESTIERIKVFDNENNSSKTQLLVCSTKSNSSNRYIPIHSALHNFLIKNYIKDSYNDFVVKGRKQDFCDPRTMQYALLNILKSCNLPKINYHALRHTFATRCIEAGVDIKSLSEILGHSSVNITLNTYIHSSIEHKRNEMQKFDLYCGQ